MSDWTGQQLARAAAEMHEAWHRGERNWNAIARKGAPYLQLIFCEPTTQEVYKAAEYMQAKHQGIADVDSIGRMLRGFVSDRMEVLLGREDPRRAKVAEAIRSSFASPTAGIVDAVTNRVMAALAEGE